MSRGQLAAKGALDKVRSQLRFGLFGIHGLWLKVHQRPSPALLPRVRERLYPITPRA